MEKIYFTKIIGSEESRNSYLAHAILESVNEKIIDLSKGKFKKGIEGMGDKDGRYLEVEFKINGIEVQFSKFIEEVGRQWNDMVKKEARSTILNAVGNFEEEIYETKDSIKNAMLRIASEKGIEITEEDRW